VDARPDRLSKGTLDNATVDQWFDRTAFPAVPTGAYRFGTSGRNVLDGPGTMAINMALSRRIRFAESKALQLRLETFNLPNHPNFNLPDNFLGSPTFGRISSARDPRHLQLGVKLLF
jgi:hypothetical protein